MKTDEKRQVDRFHKMPGVPPTPVHGCCAAKGNVLHQPQNWPAQTASRFAVFWPVRDDEPYKTKLALHHRNGCSTIAHTADSIRLMSSARRSAPTCRLLGGRPTARVAFLFKRVNRPILLVIAPIAKARVSSPSQTASIIVMPATFAVVLVHGSGIGRCRHRRRYGLSSQMPLIALISIVIFGSRCLSSFLARRELGAWMAWHHDLVPRFIDRPFADTA